MTKKAAAGIRQGRRKRATANDLTALRAQVRGGAGDVAARLKAPSPRPVAVDPNNPNITY